MQLLESGFEQYRCDSDQCLHSVFCVEQDPEMHDVEGLAVDPGAERWRCRQLHLRVDGPEKIQQLRAENERHRPGTAGDPRH